jgi:hypothetical protein
MCTCDGSDVVTFAPGKTPQGQTVAVDLVAADISAGDVIEFNGGGGVYPIRRVDARRNRLLLTVNGPNTDGNAVSVYRILRRPIPVSGEDVLELPDGAVIDPASSLNVPVGPGGSLEVLFSPHGGLTGRGTTSNDIVALWIRDAAGDDPKLVLVITPYTGFIAVKPAGPAANPFQFCRDARASGL